MIQEITIKNFQSHKDTKIDLIKNGVNVIIGASDQGKSAILRALLWAVNNRPLGTDTIVSHWARNEKGKITDTMSVKVKTDLGYVTRQRTENDNQYILQNEDKEKIFSAINKDVPEDINNFFRLNDVNIQQQHDAPFLLSSSASDVAKYFNKIVRLDVIDTVLSNAESKRRELNKKIKEADNEIKSLEKEITNYNWLGLGQELINKLSKINERLHLNNELVDALVSDIDLYKEQRNFLKNYPDIKQANILIEKIINIVIDYETVNDTENSIQKYKEVNRDRKIFEMIKPGKELINQIENEENIIKSLKEKLDNLENNEIKSYTENVNIANLKFDKKQVNKIISEIESIHPDYDTIRMLNEQIQEYNQNEININNLNNQLKELKKSLPDICPTCGQPIKECVE